MERGCLLLGLWGLVLCAHTMAMESVESNPLGETQERNKRARGPFMFGKREDDGDSASFQEDKRPFGLGSYKWNAEQDESDGINEDDAIGGKRAFGTVLSAGRPRRRFLFGKRGFDGDEYEGDDKRARMFSFGRRSDDSSIPYGSWSTGQEKRSDADLDLNALLASDDSLDGPYTNSEADKRGRLVMLGKRPFGAGIHRWGSSFGRLDDGDRSFMRDEKRLDQDKRIFKFGKRAV